MTVLKKFPYTAYSDCVEFSTDVSLIAKMPAQGHRLYVKAKHLSFQRSKHVIHPGTSIVKIEGCDSKEEAQFYLGKRVCYVYKSSKAVRGSKIRVIWG